MSFFLLEFSGWVSTPSRQGNPLREQFDQPNKAQMSFKRFDRCMKKHIEKHKEFTNTFMTDEQQTKTYGVLFPNISNHFKGLLSITYKKRNQKASVILYLLNKAQHFFKFQSKQLLNQFHRMIFLDPETQKLNVKLSLNNKNGALSLQLSYFSLSECNLVQDMDHCFLFKSKNLILEIYKTFFSPLIPLFQKALMITIPIQRRVQEVEEDKMISNIRRYCKMMTLKAFLNSETMMHQQTRINQLNRRQKNSQNLFQHQINIDGALIRPFSLFGVWKSPLQQKKNSKRQFFISPFEEKSLIAAIAFDEIDAGDVQANSHSNILNYIKINEPTKVKTHPLNYGGFSMLESADLSFWFVDSFESKKQPEMNPRTMVRRYVAIKKENRPHGKNFHEYKILMEMRNGVNSLFPKYYIPLNMPGSDYNVNPIIMMDLLPDGNLVEFLKYKFHFLSLISKVYLMFSITMSLRYLQAYNIVHLDLKPNNIMLAPGLLIKLIDFGESFHPEVCRSPNYRYRPGFTLPYSPPEFMLGLKHGFTSKSDVYSLGILMFEILYGKVPFQKRDYLFLAAQNSDLYGDPVIIRILNCVITRCLSRNIDLRPQLDWIAVILRLCLEIII